MKKKATGSQGSWFAKVDGVQYPCVWENLHTTVSKSMTYCDTGLSTHEGKQKEDYVSAIKSQKQVILASMKKDENGNWLRDGYIALYSIDNVEFENEVLTFKFSQRLQDLK